jgi:hypothetical protein
MKTSVRHWAILLAVTVVCQAGLALAEDFYFVSDGTRTAPVASKDKAAANAQAPCFSCGEASSCEQACGACCNNLGCDECPGRGIVGFAGLDSFKGVSDDGLPGNFGAVTGLNAAMPVPGLQDYGIGWQLGMSYGIYDVDGRVSLVNPAQSQQQIFVTTGFFHKAQGDRRLSFGLVYDWMINNNWGVFGTAPTLGQWRGQIEYAVSGCNAFGVWGAIGDLNSEQHVPVYQQLGIDVKTTAISQVNFFWHHKFCSGADSWVWVGVPETERLGGAGSLGTWTIGANVQVPLSDRLALYANGSYFRPSEAAGVVAAVENGYDVGMGIVWYFGRHAVSHSINGACGLPYMPLGNNSNFLVDQAVRSPL